MDTVHIALKYLFCKLGVSN